VRDQWHAEAVRVSRTLGGVGIVTTEEVLTEFLAHFCGYGPVIRRGSVRYVERILGDPDVLVREQSHQTFLSGLALYRARPDQGYSLTDCISMEAMRQERITDVLTHDVHFAREGFTILL
jgi:predicted nucleic acid-binding protein